MFTREIVGKEVIGANGFRVGKIKDTEFDVNSWKLNSLEVELEKDVAEEHNLRHRFRKTKVLIHVDHVQGIGDSVVLKGSKEDLLKLIATASSAGEKEQQQVQAQSDQVSASSQPTSSS